MAMTSEERRSLIDAKIAAELAASERPRLFWLSFCDPDLPKGQQFLGVAIVEAHGPATAMTMAWDNGCNPGGEIACVEVPESERPKLAPFLNRLLSREDLRLAGLF